MCRSRGAGRTSRLIAALAATVIGGGVLADFAAAEVSCVYTEAGEAGPAGNELEVFVDDTFSPAVALGRFGTEIQVVDHGLRGGISTCAGGTPHVTNIDTISITGPPGTEIKLFEFAGKFAPGATDEGDDSSEIEIFVEAPSATVSVGTGDTPNRIRLGAPHFINLNAQADSVPDFDLTAPAISTVEIYGGDADDEAIAGRSYPARVNMFGHDRDDVLIGGVADDFILGGPGEDRVSGQSGNDDLRGGPGADRVLAGKRSLGGATLIGGGGPDHVDARNGARDRVFCGSGRDEAHVDRLDRVVHCERVVLPN